MDGDDRRQSQYGPPYQPPAANRRLVPGQSMGPPPIDTYPRTGSQQPRVNNSMQSSGRSYVPEYNYGYQQPHFTSQVQYSGSYVTDPQRHHQLQHSPAPPHFSTYGQSPMLPPAGQQPLYDNIPQYQQQQQQQQRQSTALEVMTGQFGSGNIQYVPHGDPASAVGITQPSPPFLSSQSEQQPYTSVAFGRPQLQPPFVPSTSDYLTLERSVPEQSREDLSTRRAVDEDRRQYEQQVMSAFDDINVDRVTEASSKILGATEWLVGSVRALGMHHDDEEHHTERIEMWRELNHAWEALGQKQKSITTTALRTQQQPPDLLSSAAIHNLIDKLVQLCDQIEKFGLVDYEMGIWEEQIVDIFVQCLDLLPQAQGAARPVSHDQ